ncbi:E3 ubiquitin-protein ligase Nedd-4 [Sarcoptes scabiei]|nr:E3 ubiquitin-protein ligase Nedd-4 [Sarcoptes scabiei]
MMNLKDNPIDFLDRFENVFQISHVVANDTRRPHPRFKNNEQNDNVVKDIQNKRRNEFLQRIIKKREELLSKLRHLSQYDFDDYEDSCDILFEESIDYVLESEISNSIEIDPNSIESKEEKSYKRKRSEEVVIDKNHRRIPPRKNHRKLIADKFMLSEWLVDVPEDFFRNWFMMCCPKGRRTMIIASNGQTKVYTRTGYYLFRFQSLIPGGSRTWIEKHNQKSKKSILDCIFVETEQTFYILDVIVWNGCSIFDCDTEFRFYWMHNNIGEVLFKDQKDKIHHQNKPSIDVEMQEEVSGREVIRKNSPSSRQFSSGLSHLSFKPIDYWPCTVDNIRESANLSTFKKEIDGILFYHKQAPYTSGVTPLVCWLKIPMLPKIFPQIFSQTINNECDLIN